MRNWATVAVLAALLAVYGLSGFPAPAGAELGSCVKIDRVTSFAPRGEVYVEVRATCRADDFPDEEALVVYLELLLGDQPAVTHDLRFEPEQPDRRETVVFENRELEEGDSILVRLMLSGRVLALRKLVVP